MIYLDTYHRLVESHPARLSLRLLATKRLLVYLAVYLGLFRLLGWGLAFSLLILMIILSLLLLVTSLVACVKEDTRTRTSLLDTSDILEEGTKKRN